MLFTHHQGRGVLRTKALGQGLPQGGGCGAKVNFRV
jgi:hypothetical protein